MKLFTFWLKKNIISQRDILPHLGTSLNGMTTDFDFVIAGSNPAVPVRLISSVGRALNSVNQSAQVQVLYEPNER